MDSVARIFRRDGEGEKPIDNNDSVIKLLIALLVVVFVGLISVIALMLVRRHRRKQQQMMRETLPSYQDVKKTGNHRRLTITTSGGNGRSSVIVVGGGNGSPMLANPNSPPDSPDNVPEIHITFPDEQDDQGRPKSGRVVVVRVGETSIGLEPLHDEQLPAYEKESSSQFYSIDMEKIGGLKEKEFN